MMERIQAEVRGSMKQSNKTLEIRELDPEAVKQIYEAYMPLDFHKDELKPLKRIEVMTEEGTYCCYGLYEEGALAAYAFFCRAKEGKYYLLDYFAVLEGMRSGGYGSRFLALLCDYFKARGLSGIILETEHLDFPRNEEEKLIRRRRVDFYLRNGLRLTPVFSKINGVAYMIMSLPVCEQASDRVIYAELGKIYHAMFTEEFYHKWVELREAL